MIRIKKESTPAVLLRYEAEWTQALLDAVKQYGSFGKVPENERKKLLSHYAHEEIKRLLFRDRKCAYCECVPEGSSLQVEHFEPKSLYPELAFHWDNLLPACASCNAAKKDYDTRREPIINPAAEDPEALLEYEQYNPSCIAPVQGTGQEEKAARTVEVCNLNRLELLKARSALQVNLSVYMQLLRDAIDNYREADTPKKQQNRIRKMKLSLDTIHSLLSDSSQYAGFCRWFVKHQNVFSEAEELVETAYQPASGT